MLVQVQCFGQPPSIGLVEGLLLVAENLPRSHTATDQAHATENRQVWMLIGTAMRCASALGLEKVRPAVHKVTDARLLYLKPRRRAMQKKSSELESPGLVSVYGQVWAHMRLLFVRPTRLSAAGHGVLVTRTYSMFRGTAVDIPYRSHRGSSQFSFSGHVDSAQPRTRRLRFFAPRIRRAYANHDKRSVLPIFERSQDQIHSSVSPFVMVS